LWHPSTRLSAYHLHYNRVSLPQQLPALEDLDIEADTARFLMQRPTMHQQGDLWSELWSEEQDEFNHFSGKGQQTQVRGQQWQESRRPNLFAIPAIPPVEAASWNIPMSDQIEISGESVPGSPRMPSHGSPRKFAAFRLLLLEIFTARQARQASRDATRKKDESDRLRFAKARIERIRRLEEIEEHEEMIIRSQEEELLKSLSPDKSHAPRMEISSSNENLRRLTMAEQLQDQQDTVTELRLTISSGEQAFAFERASQQQVMEEMRAAIEDLTSQRRATENSSQYLSPMIRLPPAARSTQLSYATARSESESPTRLSQGPAALPSSFEFSRLPQPLNSSRGMNQDITLYRPHLPHMQSPYGQQESSAPHHAPSPGPFAVSALEPGNFEVKPSSLPRTSMGVAPAVSPTPPAPFPNEAMAPYSAVKGCAGFSSTSSAQSAVGLFVAPAFVSMATLTLPSPLCAPLTVASSLAQSTSDIDCNSSPSVVTVSSDLYSRDDIVSCLQEVELRRSSRLQEQAELTSRLAEIEARGVRITQGLRNGAIGDRKSKLEHHLEMVGLEWDQAVQDASLRLQALTTLDQHDAEAIQQVLASNDQDGNEDEQEEQEEEYEDAYYDDRADDSDHEDDDDPEQDGNGFSGGGDHYDVNEPDPHDDLHPEDDNNPDLEPDGGAGNFNDDGFDSDGAVEALRFAGSLKDCTPSSCTLIAALLCSGFTPWPFLFSFVLLSSIRLVQNGVLSNQAVFDTTWPLVLQFGMPPYRMDIPTIFLVTLDMSQMYDLLISNDASHSFHGTTSNNTQTLTLIRPDGVNVVVPLRPLP